MNGDRVRELLRRIDQDSLRNVFAHAILVSDQHKVAFIHRKVEQEYRPIVHVGTPDDFITHVHEFTQLSLAFEQAAGLSDKEVRSFGAVLMPEKEKNAQFNLFGSSSGP
jgi:hypothetical protein